METKLDSLVGLSNTQTNRWISQSSIMTLHGSATGEAFYNMSRKPLQKTTHDIRRLAARQQAVEGRGQRWHEDSSESEQRADGRA